MHRFSVLNDSNGAGSLLEVRKLIGAVLALASVVIAPAQTREGAYAPAGAQKVPWSIDGYHRLIWGGLPYIPYGERIDGTLAAVEAARAAGIHDVLVDVPAGGPALSELVAALEAAKMRYLLRIDSLAPMATGFAVEPEGYRVPGIDKTATIEIDLPGATSAFLVLAAKRDGTVQSSQRVPVINGHLSYIAHPGPAMEHVLLVYPEMESLQQLDYWDGLDRQRDLLLATLKKTPLGPGLRGIVNPLGRTLSLASPGSRFVPTSDFFRWEFQAALEQKYKSIETLQRAWSLSANDLNSFADLARLVPLWSGVRGVPQLLDPQTNRTYPCDSRLSRIWQDIGDVIGETADRRLGRLVSAIQGVADVPVIQDWLGWASPYEASHPSLSGVGMHVNGATPSDLANTASRPVSSILRWQSNGWLLATEIDPGQSNDAAGQLNSVIDDLASMGCRGFFLKSPSQPYAKPMASEVSSRADTGWSATSPIPLFYPENASNPAAPQRLPGSRWWLPTPGSGNRLDFGTKFYGYRLADGKHDLVALWPTQAGRYRLRMTDPSKATFENVDGSPVNPRPFKGGVEVSMTAYPLLVTKSKSVPVPEQAYFETVANMDELMTAADKQMRDISEERLYFKDFLNGFERNPGGNFPQMRGLIARVAYKVGLYTWVEAERTPDTNFSEAVDDPSSSGGKVLALRARILPPSGPFFANYQLTVRTKAQQELWMSARIPAERRADVKVIVDGQAFAIRGEPISLYGAGFGWYKLGTLKLSGNAFKLRIEVQGTGAELDFDAITLTPRPFEPTGVSYPSSMDFGVLKPKKKKKSGRGVP